MQAQPRQAAPFLVHHWLTQAIDDQLGNHARSNRHQHIVAAVLHPLVTTRWLVQAVTTPVMHHIACRTVLRWQTRALVPVVSRPSAPVMVNHHRRWRRAITRVVVHTRWRPGAPAGMVLGSTAMGMRWWSMAMPMGLGLRQRRHAQSQRSGEQSIRSNSVQLHGASFQVKDSSQGGCHSTILRQKQSHE